MSIFVDEPVEGENDFDRVETDVVVDATVERAWALVSEPGWWVNDGPLGDHDVTRGDDGVYRVNDPEAGQWLIEKADGRTTRVEISLSEERGGVAIHVEESGLSSVSDDEDVVRQAWEDEAGMWDQVLTAAKEYLES